MEDGMIERVARAIARKAGEATERASHVRFYQSFSGIEEYVEMAWRSHSDQARAAIEAMPVMATIREMYDEYMKDECCDYVVINGLIEKAAEEIGCL